LLARFGGEFAGAPDPKFEEMEEKGIMREMSPWTAS
jgi:hypothetical protein